MKRALSVLLLLLSLPSVHGALGAEDLFRGLMASLAPDKEVVIQELTLPPGSVGRPHRHSGYVYVYVVEGTVDMAVEGGEVTRLTAGQVFVEAPDDIHSVMNNPSETEVARFVAFIVQPADAPIVAPVGR